MENKQKICCISNMVVRFSNSQIKIFFQLFSAAITCKLCSFCMITAAIDSLTNVGANIISYFEEKEMLLTCMSILSYFRGESESFLNAASSDRLNGTKV